LECHHFLENELYRLILKKCLQLDVNNIFIILNKVKKVAGHCIMIILKHLLSKFGLQVAKTGQGFISAQETVKKSRKEGLSINDYIEKYADRPEKKGRRDRVLGKLKEAGCLRKLQTVCEIGPGTGRYTEGLLNDVKQSGTLNYEIYETDVGWKKYLIKQYSSDVSNFIAHSADGKSLKYTESASCDLVHAHAVFVYLPLMQSLRYIKECFRVCIPGGFVVFDYLPSEEFHNIIISEKWLNGPHTWPAPISRELIEKYADHYNFDTVCRFTEPYGETESEYLIYKRRL
jgi:SAM-dependent methyltransferase